MTELKMNDPLHNHEESVEYLEYASGVEENEFGASGSDDDEDQPHFVASNESSSQVTEDADTERYTSLSQSFKPANPPLK